MRVFLFLFFWVLIAPSNAYSQELVRAHIGIEILSDSASKKAKANDRLKKEDQLKLYVVPKNDSFAYIINSNSKTASLLNPETNQQKIPGDSIKIFPSALQVYQPDGKENIETFTIICSPNEAKDITQLFSSGTVPVEKWQSLEKRLIENNQIVGSSPSTEILHFGGAVRGIDENPFINKLSISTGKSLVIKRYQFHVKK
ncbi:hypothetical protein UR09_04870 [Candidatus Nitromaritima sp. SCGC AAA799-A02]|nr:hypothetical protein UR09_04870 [Candidatus Nitromaritima sp. SCGC AAA799-A02]